MAPTLASEVTSDEYDSTFDDKGIKAGETGYTAAAAVYLRSRVEKSGDITILNKNGVTLGTILKGGTFQARQNANLNPNLVAKLSSVSTSLLAKNANQALVDKASFSENDANGFTGINALSSATASTVITPVNLTSFASPTVRKDFGTASFPANRDPKQDHIKFSIKKYGPIKLDPKTPTSIKRSIGTSIGEIILPIQPSISDSNTVRWGEDRLNPIQAAGATTAVSTMSQKTPQAAAKQIVTGLIDSLTVFGGESENVRQGIIASFAGEAISNQNLLSRLNGAVLNPNLELLFQGPELRNFNFNFQLTPRSKKDVEQIRFIIRRFKQAMAVQKSASELFLSAPHVFGIEYIFGKDGTGKTKNPYLPLIKDCALTNFSVDYTPDGSYMTYEDGSMTSYRLTMQFQELTPIYEDYYDGYYDDDYEYEEQSEPERVNLGEWLIKNPGEFTYKKFSPGDTIKLNKRRGLTQVIEAREGKWMPEYVVLIDGVETIIGQSDIIPL